MEKDLLEFFSGTQIKRGQTNRKKGMANVIYIQQTDNPIKQRL